MNKIVIITTAFMLILLTCNAQQQESTDFIPEGYSEFKKYFGDLNKDGQDDCVLIIKKIDAENIVTNSFDETVDRNRRGIMVLFKNDEGYQLADKNDNCFSSENEDGGVYSPPELWFEIKNQKLYVYYSHGRYGYQKFTFRFQNANFELIGYDSSSNRGPVINSETSINFLTKKKLTKENTNENAVGDDEIFEETWTTIEIDKLIKLSEIQDFDALNMDNY